MVNTVHNGRGLKQNSLRGAARRFCDGAARARTAKESAKMGLINIIVMAGGQTGREVQKSAGR